MEKGQILEELAKWKGSCKSDGDCNSFEECVVCEHRDCHNRVMVYNVNTLIQERDKARKQEQIFRGAVLNLKWAGEYPNRICPFCGYNESKSMAHGKDCPYWMAEHI